MAALAGAYLAFSGVRAPGTVSREVFTLLTWVTFAGALGSGVFLTADALSSERREGTLGLLFLTELNGLDVALGKLVASSIQGSYALIGVLPMLGTGILVTHAGADLDPNRIARHRHPRFRGFKGHGKGHRVDPLNRNPALHPTLVSRADNGRYGSRPSLDGLDLGVEPGVNHQTRSNKSRFAADLLDSIGNLTSGQHGLWPREPNRGGLVVDPPLADHRLGAKRTDSPPALVEGVT